MCGIFAVIGPGISKKDVDIFYNLGVVNMLRGMDGAGIFIIDSSKKHKSVKVGEDFVSLKYQIDALKNKHDFYSCTNLGFVGHTRWATVGDIDANSAHPFEQNRISIGIHNGTITDETEYGKNIHQRIERETKSFNNDSEALLNDIANQGFDRVLTKLDDNVDAYAIINWDIKKKIFNFVRNEKRPLFVATNNTRRVAYISSEKGALEYILDRELGPPAEDKDEEPRYNIYYATPRDVFSLDPQFSKKLRPWTSVPLSETKCIKIKKPVQTPLLGYGGHNPSNVVRDWHDIIG